MRIVVFMAFALLLVSCTTEEEGLEQRVLNKLVSNWQLKGQPSYELWTKQGDEKLKGKGYTYLGKDSTITEKIILEKNKEQWEYKVDLLGRQNPNNVNFVLDSISENTLRFSNKEHDFPQNLLYHWPNDTIMQVTLTGENNAPVYFVFKKR